MDVTLVLMTGGLSERLNKKERILGSNRELELRTAIAYQPLGQTMLEMFFSTSITAHLH